MSAGFDCATVGKNVKGHANLGGYYKQISSFSALSGVFTQLNTVAYIDREYTNGVLIIILSKSI
jgi:hypothetical protein